MKAHNLFIQKDENPDAECPYVLIGSHDLNDGMGGAVAHVFGDDEAAAEKLAREILDGLSVAGGGESGMLEVNQYQLMGGSAGDIGDIRIVRCRQVDGSSEWEVVEGQGFILNRDGKWEINNSVYVKGHAPKRFRFGTVEEALRCWQTAVMRSVYDEPVQERPDEEIVRDILLLVCEQEVDLGFLTNLANDELTSVVHWASLTYYAASDNDGVEVPPMPHCLAAYFSPSGLRNGG